MPRARTHRFQPRVERLEPLQLLSAGLQGRRMVHQADVVELKASTVARDIVRAIASSTASFRRDDIVLDALRADDAQRTVSGAAHVNYKIGLLGTVTSNILFTTSLDNPRPGDVKVNVSKFSLFVGSKAKAKVGTAIASVIRRDHDQIVALFPGT